MNMFCRFLLLILWFASSKAFCLANILIVGDSLSAAYGMEPSQGWPALLEQRLQKEGLSFQVVNISTSGETTQGGLEKLPTALQEYQPSIVILALGANDGLRGLPVISMEENLNQLVLLSQKSKATVLLVGMLIPINYGPLYRKEFAKAYQRVIEKYELAHVPFLLEGVALKPAFLQEDGLHPNAAAQPLILENIWPSLKKIMGSGPNKR